MRNIETMLNKTNSLQDSIRLCTQLYSRNPVIPLWTCASSSQNRQEGVCTERVCYMFWGGVGGVHKSSHLPLSQSRRSKLSERTAEFSALTSRLWASWKETGKSFWNSWTHKWRASGMEKGLNGPPAVRRMWVQGQPVTFLFISKNPRKGQWGESI